LEQSPEGSALRPGDIKVYDWSDGSRTECYFDVTVVDSAAQLGYVGQGRDALAYLQVIYDKKIAKHATACNQANALFCPLVFDVGGGCHPETGKIIQRLAVKMADNKNTKIIDEITYLRQSISTTLQYANGRLIAKRRALAV
jgi:hypothetical protein